MPVFLAWLARLTPERSRSDELSGTRPQHTKASAKRASSTQAIIGHNVHVDSGGNLLTPGVVALAGAASLSSPVEVAAATLAAAALFNPLRRRVQRVVDRRFNRARYDADRTVAAFAARRQDTVDLDSVRADLAGVVHQALEPAHVSLWISQRD